MTPESYLHKDGDNIVVKVGDETKGRIPIHNIESIVCFNYVGVSPRFMEMCVNNKILISFLSSYGSFLARVDGRVSGNVLLRKKQYYNSDSPLETTLIAKNIIVGKLVNYKTILSRFVRDHSEKVDDSFTKNLNDLSIIIKKIYNYSDTDIDVLRGYEGLGSRLYFSNFDKMILVNKEDFYFNLRSKRPPLDNVNCLLSFLYVLLSHECTSALEMVGLDPQVGFLHRVRPRRSSLALDLVEEFRGYLGDRLALTLINNRVVNKKDFHKKENDAILLTDDGRKKIIEAYQKRKKDIITHQFLNEKIEIGLIPYAQSMLLARVIRGDLESYPVFMFK